MKVRECKGFSMIEVLISMVVATIIMVGVYSFLTSSQRSFVMVQANDSMNRDMQMTNRNITDYLHMAGFRNYRRVFNQITFPHKVYKFGGNDITFAYNSFLAASDETGTSSTDPKRNHIYIRYWGSSLDDDMDLTVTNTESNRRMYDCQGVFLTRDELAVVHLFIGSGGLTCEHQIFDNSNTLVRSASVVINPDITNLMFAFRMDDSSSFYLVGEMTNVKNYETVNAVKYGFIVRQNSHQKANSVGDLEYHVLGMDDNDDKVVIPQGGDDRATTDIYNLISGVVYSRNRFYEINL